MYNKEVKQLTVEEIIRCVKEFKPEGVSLYTFTEEAQKEKNLQPEVVNMYDLCNPWKIRNEQTDPVDILNYVYTYLSLFLDRTIQAIQKNHKALIIDYGNRISVEYIGKNKSFVMFDSEKKEKLLTKDQARTQVIRFVLENLDDKTLK